MLMKRAIDFDDYASDSFYDGLHVHSADNNFENYLGMKLLINKLFQSLSDVGFGQNQKTFHL